MKVTPKKRKRNKLDSFDRKWEMHFFELQKFKKKYGHCDVPQNHSNKNYHLLARWCQHQREYKKFKPLKYPPDRLRKLTKLGFNWVLYDKWFDDKFNELKQYYEKYGHCNLTRTENNKKYKNLTYWVIKQRHHYQNKNKDLTPERIAKLNSIGFSWVNPIKQGDLRRINNSDLLNELKRLHLMRGIPPSASYINNHGKYCSHTYCNHFGNMANARKAAGINSGSSFPKKYSDAQLLGDLKRLATLLDKIPRTGDIEKYGEYSIKAYQKRFGSLVNARKEAGINIITIFPKRYSDAQLLDDLKRLATFLGKTPRRCDIEKHGKYSFKIYPQRFGNLADACIMAGLEK